MQILVKAVEKQMRYNLRLFAAGALGYPLIELMYRRHTHWCMAIVGGLAMIGMGGICKRLSKRGLWYSALVSALYISLLELFSGLILNRALRLKIWDYSQFRYNVFGQICPLFCLYWLALAVPICAILRCEKSHDFRDFCGIISLKMRKN